MKKFRHKYFSIALVSLSLAFFSVSIAKEDNLNRISSSGPEKKSDDVLLVADWVIKSQDNRELSFVIVDKKQSKLFVFDSEGRILASTPVLLGLAFGDLSTPGVGNMKLSQIPPKDRTTAAGRFLLRHGFNLEGGKVLWIDFEAALAIHPVSKGPSHATRLKLLQSKNPNERRVTLGCVNVTDEFYNTVLSPLFDRSNGYAYILPETMPVASFFGINR